MCTCTHALTPSSPRALFRQYWGTGYWISSRGSLPSRKLPADLNPAEGTLLLFSPFPVRTQNTEHRLKMIWARQLCPQHIQSSEYQLETFLGIADPNLLHQLAQSQCAAGCLEPDFSPSPLGAVCCWENLDVGSIQTKSIRRGLYEPAAAEYLKGRLSSVYLASEVQAVTLLTDLVHIPVHHCVEIMHSEIKLL